MGKTKETNGFFQLHKFKIIISGIVLILLLLILYLFTK